MSQFEVVKSIPDATVLSIVRSFDSLSIHLRLWDDRAAVIAAEGVGPSWDTGTWECDALVRMRALDDGDRIAFGIISGDSIATLRFLAANLKWHGPDSGHPEDLASVERLAEDSS